MRALRLLLAGLATVAVGEAPPVQPGMGPEIIVEGRKLDRAQVARAVRAISRPESTGGFEFQYPRWTEQICVLVANFPREGGQFIADRIGTVARDLKLDAGGPGCAPNIFIFLTDDPTKLIATFRLKRRWLVNGKNISVLRRIQNSQDAVRWIGATKQASASGEPLVQSGLAAPGRTVEESRRYGGGSRLVASTQTALSRETIVVDSRKLGGISYPQLADYLSFVALSQLSPQAAPEGIASILSLFSGGRSAPTELTAFDRAYLKGLYQSPISGVGVVQQGAINAAVNRALKPT